MLYVPEIDQNLVSVGQLLEDGYSLFFINGICTIKDDQGIPLFTAKMINRCFSIGKHVSHISMSINATEKSILWHKRLGHFNYATLKKMAALHVVEGLPEIHEQNDVCEACQLGKQSMIKFSKSAIRTTTKLQIVHIDVCGPMHNESLNDLRYFLLFIDDYNRYCWVFFLKSKIYVFYEFVKFKTTVEVEIGEKMKVLRSDNGGEFTSQRFKDF